MVNYGIMEPTPSAQPHRLILKEDDILLVKLPMEYFRAPDIMKTLYAQIKKQLLPRKNNILMLPSDLEVGVIAKKEVKEMVSQVDLWQLWGEEGEE